MAACDYCADELSGYPFKCRLCQQPFCGSHRLPESHECINIHVYRSNSYYNVTLAKQREMQRIKAGGGQVYSPSKSYGTSGINRPLDPDNLIKGGIIHGFIAVLQFSVFLVFIYLNFRNSFNYNLRVFGIILLSSLVYSIIVYQVINHLRNDFLKYQQAKSTFEINEEGLAITIITALIIFPILMYGSFRETEPINKQERGELAFRTTYFFYAGWVIAYILTIIFNDMGMQSLYNAPSITSSNDIISATLPFIIATGIYLSGYIFFIYTIFSFVPFFNFRGDLMLETDRNKFWGSLLVVILTFIFLSNYISVLPMFIIF